MQYCTRCSVWYGMLVWWKFNSKRSPSISEAVCFRFRLSCVCSLVLIQEMNGIALQTRTIRVRIDVFCKCNASKYVFHSILLLEMILQTTITTVSLTQSARRRVSISISISISILSSSQKTTKQLLQPRYQIRNQRRNPFHILSKFGIGTVPFIR